MDPTVIAAIFALASAITVGAFSMRTGRGQLANAAGDNLRDDLLQRIDQQNERITALEAKGERQELRIDRLQLENSDLRAHIVVLRQWGMWSDQPIPREPPPWQPTVVSHP